MIPSSTALSDHPFSQKQRCVSHFIILLHQKLFIMCVCVWAYSTKLASLLR